MWNDMKKLERLLDNYHTSQKKFAGKLHEFASLCQHEEPVDPFCSSVEEASCDIEEKLGSLDDKETVIGSVSAAKMPIIDALCTDISCISEVEVPYIDAKQMKFSFSDDIVHCGMSKCDGLHVHHSSSAEFYEIIDGEVAVPCLKEILYDNEIEADDKSHVTEASKSDSCSVSEIETQDISEEFQEVRGWSCLPVFDPGILSMKDGAPYQETKFPLDFVVEDPSQIHVIFGTFGCSMRRVQGANNQEMIGGYACQGFLWFDQLLKLLGQSDQLAATHLCNIPSPPAALDSAPSSPFLAKVENMEQIEVMEHMYLLSNNCGIMEAGNYRALVIPSKAANYSALLYCDPFWTVPLTANCQSQLAPFALQF